uniref:Ceramide transfer protein n=1 Tax=Ciona savignyi TaxID=51511 RepID=H2ZIZ6_CIOSA
MLDGVLGKWTNYYHGWQDRFVICQEGTLSYYRAQDETEFGCRGSISLTKASVVCDEFDTCRFDVTVGDNIWYLRATDETERQKWVDVIELNKAVIPSKSRKVKKRSLVFSPSMSSLPPMEETKDLHEKMDELRTFQKILDKQVTKLQGYFDVFTDENNNKNNPERLNAVLEQTDFKGEAITFRATASGILNSLSQCLQLINNRELLWQTRQPPPVHHEIKKLDERIDEELNSDDEDVFFDPEADLMQNKITHRHSKELNKRIQEHLSLIDRSGNEDSGWDIIAEDGEMKLYRKELVINGLICDPLKAVHSVGSVTAKEMCHYFWVPEVRKDWEKTEVFQVLENLDEFTTINYQTHKQVWPAAQRDCLYLSSMVKVDSPPCAGDKTPHDTWIVCNFSVDHPEVNSVPGCVRALIEVALICQTFITPPKDGGPITRDCLQCDIVYVANVNPGGWAPASVLRSIYKREYPKFLNFYTNYVQEKRKDLEILF